VAAGGREEAKAVRRHRDPAVLQAPRPRIETLLAIICSLGQLSFDVHCIFDVGHIATFLVL
jgi:hypothetical protein